MEKQEKKEQKEKKVDTKENKVITFIKKYAVLQYTIIGIALFFLSIMLTAQMKSISNTNEIIQGKRETQLAEDLITLQSKYNDLKTKYDEKSQIVEEYQNSAALNDTLISSMKQENDSLSALAGSTDLKGEGIIITLTDGEKIIDPVYRSDSLVHDADLITVVNELKVAGAEAISINGQRIISTSGIRCVGTVIQVNYQKVAAPFEIKVIGNAQYLESAMTVKNGVADSLKMYGVGVNIVRKSEIKIPKHEGTLSFKHAIVDK